jgi:hypothetical protein
MIVAQAVMAVAAPEVSGVFRANVVVTVSRHPAAFTLDAAADELRAATIGLPDVAVVGTERVTRTGLEQVEHEVSFRHGDAGTVIQSHVLYVVDQGRACDVVHVIGTCGGDRFAEDLSVLRSCLGSIETTPAPVDGQGGPK